MKTFRLFVFIMIVVGLAMPASAQFPKIPSAPRPGMLIVEPTTQPIEENVVRVRVISHNGETVKNPTVRFSLVTTDPSTGRSFPNHAKSVLFKLCEGGKIIDCMMPDGTGTFLNSSLPQSEDPSYRWRELDIRAESMTHVHHLVDKLRIFVDGSRTVDAQIQMYNSGFEARDPYAYPSPYDNRVIMVGFWSKQDWPEEVLVDFFFKASSWTKSQVRYPRSPSVRAEIGPGPNGDGGWIEVPFWTIKNYTADFDGSVCGDIQIRSAYESESVRAQFNEVCVRMQRPDSVVIVR